MRKEDFIKKYGIEKYEKWRNQTKQYYENNKDKLSEYHKKYQSKYIEEHRKAQRIYYENHKEYYKELKRKYRKTKSETQRSETQRIISDIDKIKSKRASILAKCYKRNDKYANRGESTITRLWILENIFTSKCVYCGETDWTKLGCDRIDNTKPHTPDNVVCSCWNCNRKQPKKGINIKAAELKGISH